MPGFLLHQNATVNCIHGGQAQATAPSPRVKVMGQPVVAQPTPHTVVGCAFAPGGVPSPCVTAQWISGAIRVKVDGVPVLLQDSQAACIPNGTGVQILVTQTRVRGS